MQSLAEKDIKLFKIIKQEKERQNMHLDLIASENYSSQAVIDALGSALANKYVKGYPSKRHYGGCAYIDDIENEAINRAKQLFGASYVNVQPYSVSQANQAIMLKLLKPKDNVLNMSFSHGGHFEHGKQFSLSGSFFNNHFYELNKEGFINYDELLEVAKKCQPKMIFVASESYSRIIDWPDLKRIADTVNAFLLIDVSHYAGLIAAGEYPNPIGYADFVTSTTNKTLRGPMGGMILSAHDIIKKQGQSIKIEPYLNKAIFPYIQDGPIMTSIAAKAVCFKEAMTEDFKLYAKQVVHNARELCKSLEMRGYNIVSKGTDSHMFLIDLQNHSITGEEAEEVLQNIGITVNKISIPNDPLPTNITSGIRIGTPAITTRGMGEKEMNIIADIIDDTLYKYKNDLDYQENIEQVSMLCNSFPIYYPI